MDKVCNICGGVKFNTGPNGRKSIEGSYPRCETCQSLERHRSIRSVFKKLHELKKLNKLTALQFSKDHSVDPKWFKKFECSIYGGANSLDLCKIDRPNNSYDIVICNHVLEHVENDTLALNEMLRILNPNGIIFLTLPDPARLSKTKDWGFPDQNLHGHYRCYGSDIEKKFDNEVPEAIWCRINLIDNITNTKDVAYILCKKINDLYGFLAKPNKNELKIESFSTSTEFMKVQGWMDKRVPNIVEIWHNIFIQNNKFSSTLEIGVHHGRFFLILERLTPKSSKCFAVDVFEDQEKNIDNSGCGSFDLFMDNINTLAAYPSRVTPYKSDSFNIRALKMPQSFSLISIDGGHTKDHTYFDLSYADQTIDPGGLIILDDFNNPNWLGVMDGAIHFLNQANKRIAPIMVGYNKLFLTTISESSVVQKKMEDSIIDHLGPNALG